MAAPETKLPTFHACGHWIVDINKRIDHWPEPTTLALIEESMSTNGGAAFNVSCDLARLEVGLAIEGTGLIGEDEPGDYVLETCRALGIGTAGLKRTQEAPTSYTEVMTEKESGRRTFFHAYGASGLLAEEHFGIFRDGAGGVFFLGYLGLLPTLDRTGPEGGNGSSRLFARVSAAGMTTAADLVSMPNARLVEQVSPCLPHLDMFFTNEWEASRLVGRPLASGVAVSFREAAELARAVVAMGVRGRVVLHFAEGAVTAGRDGEVRARGAVRVPREHIAGTVGAGDAFAAGYLAGHALGFDTEQSLELAVCTAASSLRHITCSEGVRPWRECLEYGRSLGFRATE